MTWLHWILLVVCIAAAIAACDMLGHRGTKPWPAGLLFLAALAAAAWLYNSWLAAGALGFGTGLLIYAGTNVVKSIVLRRHLKKNTSERDLTTGR